MVWKIFFSNVSRIIVYKLFWVFESKPPPTRHIWQCIICIYQKIYHSAFFRKNLKRGKNYFFDRYFYFGRLIFFIFRFLKNKNAFDKILPKIPQLKKLMFEQFFVSPFFRSLIIKKQWNAWWTLFKGKTDFRPNVLSPAPFRGQWVLSTKVVSVMRFRKKLVVRGHVQTTWTNEGGGGVTQMTTTLNKAIK